LHAPDGYYLKSFEDECEITNSGISKRKVWQKYKVSNFKLLLKKLFMAKANCLNTSTNDKRKSAFDVKNEILMANHKNVIKKQIKRL